jgi:hypothetical protein
MTSIELQELAVEIVRNCEEDVQGNDQPIVVTVTIETPTHAASAVSRTIEARPA